MTHDQAQQKAIQSAQAAIAARYMIGKHLNWHNSWSRDQDGHLVHTSGLRFIVTHGDGFADLKTDDASMAIFQSSETSRGVPMHQLVERIQRLTKEAQIFQESNP